MKLLKWIKFEINSLLNYYNFWRMKRAANKKHKITGKRYHVVPKSNDSLMIVDNTYIKFYNKAVKGKSKKITINDLIRMSYYSTSAKGLTR